MLTLGVVSKLSIEGVCVVALAPTMMTISGSTFHPLLIILTISGLYFPIFLLDKTILNLIQQSKLHVELESFEIQSNVVFDPLKHLKNDS